MNKKTESGIKPDPSFSLILRHAVKDEYRVTRKGYFFIGIVYDKVAALYLYGNVLAFIALSDLSGGGNSGAGTRTAGGGFAVSALPHPHVKGVFVYNTDEFGVYPLGENRRVFKFWT